jgi:hypothetical protein
LNIRENLSSQISNKYRLIEKEMKREEFGIFIICYVIAKVESQAD